MTNKINLNLLFLIILLVAISCAEKSAPDINFRVKSINTKIYDMVSESGNWDHPEYKNAFESLGNQRIVIEVKDQESGVVQVKIPWRRRDDFPQKKDVIIVDAITNQILEEKYVLEINNEWGHLIFQPNKGSNQYHVYYLPHVSTGSYYPKLEYKKPDTLKSNAWFADQDLSAEMIKKLSGAMIASAQSIDEFHSFFPMEIIATRIEMSTFTGQNDQSYYLFPEYRERPIRMQDYLPVHWTIENNINGISDKVMRGEYYTFQIGIYAPSQELRDVQITYSDFTGGNGTLSGNLVTCFNAGGVDLSGEVFDKEINVKSGKVQALWFGIEIPVDAQIDSYLGQVIVTPKGLPKDTVFVKLTVATDELIANYGDDSPENMSRLRWLNSTIGTDPNTIIRPFEPVTVADRTINILGREIVLDNFGLPAQLSSFFAPELTRLDDQSESILSQPIQFNVLSQDGEREQWQPSDYSINQTYQSSADWIANSTSDNFNLNINGHIEYDGMLKYNIQLVSKKDLNISDITLQIDMPREAAEYVMGLGLKGGKLTDDVAWKWDVTKHQEGAWLGAVNRGIQYLLRDENYERPLNTNFYQAKPLNLPPSWYNDGRGGINIITNEETVMIENYSGPRSILKGDTLNFNIRFLITPFKTIDIKEHFNTRFVHKYVPVDSVIKLDGTVVNVHHANEINPYINYPFYNIGKQKAYIEEAHAKGIKVKLYNTIRELSYKSYELFALKSLGDEILNDGEGGGHSWLQEHFKSNYHSAWHATRVNDAAILNKGTSRWTNYYIEGINWLAKNQEIDGLYLDDIAFSRTTVKRIASVLSEHRESFVIDLHSANQYNDRDGFTNSAFLYMEHFPYISRLWFGEYFEYDLAPDYWMTEVSGLPFGLTGEMLEKGGHPYRGLVYGMTTRVYGNYSPQALWKLFDQFEIANSEMLGYWVDRSPIKTNTTGIKSTIYLNGGKALIAIGSWSARNEYVQLVIDWEALGISKGNMKLTSPEIEGLQKYKVYDLDKPVLVEKKNGLILVMEPKGE